MHPFLRTPAKTRRSRSGSSYAANFDAVRKKLGSSEQAFISAAAFEQSLAGICCYRAVTASLPGSCSELKAPTTRTDDRFRPGQLAGLLPPGTYRFANTPHDARLAALAFALGGYQFSRYRKAEARNVRLVLPEGVDGDELPASSRA